MIDSSGAESDRIRRFCTVERASSGLDDQACTRRLHLLGWYV
jgi:hypothetical protein